MGSAKALHGSNAIHRAQTVLLPTPSRSPGHLSVRPRPRHQAPFFRETLRWDVSDGSWPSRMAAASHEIEMASGQEESKAQQESGKGE